MKKLLFVLFIIALIASTQSASAYYIPVEYQGEVGAIKNDVQIYQFAMAHEETPWAYDILRQLSQNYTNSGRIFELHIVMKKYLKK